MTVWFISSLSLLLINFRLLLFIPFPVLIKKIPDDTENLHNISKLQDRLGRWRRSPSLCSSKLIMLI